MNAEAPTAAKESPEKHWWLRTLAIFQAPRPVFAALRDDSPREAEARQEPILAIVVLAGIAAVLLAPETGQAPGREHRRRQHRRPRGGRLPDRARSTASRRTGSAARFSTSACAGRAPGELPARPAHPRIRRGARPCSGSCWSGRLGSSSTAPTRSARAATTRHRADAVRPAPKARSSSGRSRCCSTGSPSSSAGGCCAPASPSALPVLALLVFTVASWLRCRVAEEGRQLRPRASRTCAPRPGTHRSAPRRRSARARPGSRRRSPRSAW